MVISSNDSRWLDVSDSNKFESLQFLSRSRSSATIKLVAPLNRSNSTKFSKFLSFSRTQTQFIMLCFIFMSQFIISGHVQRIIIVKFLHWNFTYALDLLKTTVVRRVSSVSSNMRQRQGDFVGNKGVSRLPYS